MMHPDVNIERVINGVGENIRGYEVAARERRLRRGATKRGRGVGEGDCGVTIGGWTGDGCRLMKRNLRAERKREQEKRDGSSLSERQQKKRREKSNGCHELDQFKLR